MGCFQGCGQRASQAEPELRSLERFLEEKDGRGLEPEGSDGAGAPFPAPEKGQPGTGGSPHA